MSASRPPPHRIKHPHRAQESGKIKQSQHSFLHLLSPPPVSFIIPALGLVAQSVEQRIENPCVGGSIPPRATKKHQNHLQVVFIWADFA